MLHLFGTLSLYIALAFACIQSVLPLYGHYRHNPYLTACARPGALGQLIAVISAYLLLTTAFVTNDFSLPYVAANSHSSLPLMYRFTAVWGAHEGSILLWIVILNLWSFIFSIIQKKQNALTLAILGIISFCFLCFLLFTSNPFLVTTTPQSGHDLNPLLQDPGFVIHPPMLYLGYVGFSVTFAVTLGALMRGQLDQAWALLTRRFALAAWCFLTLGITLGSWWAYRVLGWGGFWFWDPVENASLLPWITGTALIHVLILTEKRDTAKRWAALLAIICFTLSLLGTFLVRSGVLISAHTFANDPARGVFLLLLLAFVMSAALIVYLLCLPKLKNAPTHFHLFSRESALLLNSILLIITMCTILLGTLYPLILDALQLELISVGAPYFNTVMLPLVLLVLFCMGFAVHCRWQIQSFKTLWQQTWKKFLCSLLVALAILWSVIGQLDVIAFISLSLSLWIIFGLNQSLRLAPSMSFAHLGFATLIIGVILSSVLSQERDVRIKPGDMVALGPYQFFFLSTHSTIGPNYRAINATFDVIKNTHHVTTLLPEKRIYTVRDMVMTKVDIHPGIFRDLYIALGEPLDQNEWTVRLYYKPFIRWIWLGGAIMILGGLLGIRRSKERGLA